MSDILAVPPAAQRVNNASYRRGSGSGAARRVRHARVRCQPSALSRTCSCAPLAPPPLALYPSPLPSVEPKRYPRRLPAALSSANCPAGWRSASFAALQRRRPALRQERNASGLPGPKDARMLPWLLVIQRTHPPKRRALPLRLLGIQRRYRPKHRTLRNVCRRVVLCRAYGGQPLRRALAVAWDLSDAA
eukprot:scaffold18992_cov113-Isochrysis_galbana.AAC.5